MYCCVMPWYFASSYVVSCCGMSCHVKLRCVMSCCCDVSCHVMLCYDMPGYVRLCYAQLYHVTLCQGMSYYARLPYVGSQGGYLIQCRLHEVPGGAKNPAGGWAR